MDPITIVCTIDESTLRLNALLRNDSSDIITVGGMNLANLRVDHCTQDDIGRPRISIHIRNSDGTYQLIPGKSLEWTWILTENFRFVVPGRYKAWVVYDSIGYRDRFALGESQWERDLTTLTPIRTLSNTVEFGIGPKVVDENAAQKSTNRLLGDE